VELLHAADGVVVVWFVRGVEVALCESVRLRPQVVVVDGQMPDGDGLREPERCATIREAITSPSDGRGPAALGTTA